MREYYFRLMEKALQAYSDDYITGYFDRVKREGLTEHGFPRLTANIGVLIAHGVRTDLLPVFMEMMDFCCENIPRVKAANDFSVREIITCLEEIEKFSVVDPSKLAYWRGCIASIVAETCYTRYALKPTDDLRNWALFTGVSEYCRLSAGLGGSIDFIDLQIETQFPWFDENGMYMDSPESEDHQPLMYDLVTRTLFAILLNRGYRGKHYTRIDKILREGGLLSLRMQSVSGEIPFGGRSNQFVHNEGWLATSYEYEIKRYIKEGNIPLAMEFGAAVARALRASEEWLSRSPISHIKNRFAIDTQYGCEHYAYFDKYMITAASAYFTASLISDSKIGLEYKDDETTSAFLTSDNFHKLFLKSGGYSIEIERNGDPHYDCSGLGRIHRTGAPSAICLSLPCPREPVFRVDIKPHALSIAAGIKALGEWRFATGNDTEYVVDDYKAIDGFAEAAVACIFKGGERVDCRYTVTDDGVSVKAMGDGEVGIMLPAFLYDGENYTYVKAEGKTLSVGYLGWVCEYETDGEISDLGFTAPNRTGHVGAYLASGMKSVSVKVRIFEDEQSK